MGEKKLVPKARNRPGFWARVTRLDPHQEWSSESGEVKDAYGVLVPEPPMFLSWMFRRREHKHEQPPRHSDFSSSAASEPRLFERGDVIGGEYKVLRAMRVG